VKLPRYAGGSKAFRAFISQHLRYPKEAQDAKVEGFVVVEYEIDDNGVVHHPRVLKGLGYGCDEEAMRVVSMLRYEKVKNRGVRVKVTTKTNIVFSLPGVSIIYNVAEKSEPSLEKEGHDKYEYTIDI